jgi:hypothetical protein
MLRLAEQCSATRPCRPRRRQVVTLAWRVWGSAVFKKIIPGRTVLALAAVVSFVAGAQAFELSGLWASDTPACDRIFATKGKATSFRKDSDVFGSGFIIDGKTIRGRMARCTIKSTKESGQNIHLLTACATDIMLGNVQFSIKVEDDNRITRIFPGVDGMEISYVRCPAKAATR